MEYRMRKDTPEYVGVGISASVLVTNDWRSLA